MNIDLNIEQRDTVLAALRWYEHSGMGDTDNRPDWLQAIACPEPGDTTSLCDESIIELCEVIEGTRPSVYKSDEELSALEDDS